MNAIRVSVLIAALLLGTAHRLPAPISEAETPSPAPDQSGRPKLKRAKPRVTDQDSESSSRQNQPEKEYGSTKLRATKAASAALPKFAGTWAGTITLIVWGTFDLTLVINGPSTSVTSKSKYGTKEHPATNDGHTITWREGVFNEVVWTLTPNSDGSAAAVTANSALGIHSTTTLRRGSTAEIVLQPTSTPVPAAVSTRLVGLPVAKPVPNKPGFVYNPFDSNTKLFLDVRNKAHGATVRDPVSGKLFIVP